VPAAGAVSMRAAAAAITLVNLIHIFKLSPLVSGYCTCSQCRDLGGAQRP
jgi:hypothetical protein